MRKLKPHKKRFKAANDQEYIRRDKVSYAQFFMVDRGQRPMQRFGGLHRLVSRPSMAVAVVILAPKSERNVQRKAPRT